ncbi:CHAP domain-containing protein [Bengtsoniella intestinalis]|uniref:CHAP domain-containing protein n=1 Tax=Bengtsoniella intestinalis TaxID=3073143 RepID=UPI00391FA257
MTAIEKLIATAQAEIGYLEKASNSQLDDPTANSGSANYTKYARDLDAIGWYNGAKQGYAWCTIFVAWCKQSTFGVEMALAMTYQSLGGLGASCTYLMGYYKSAGQFFSTPQVGDQIFFTSDGGDSAYHTGLVYAVDGTKVYTIEGNTSSASGVVENGGAVAAKSYSLTYSKIAGYGRPDYSLYEDETEEEEMRYNKVSEMPAYAQTTIKKLIDAGHIQGSGTVFDEDNRPADVDLSLDMIRMFVVNDRAGIYG